MLGVLHGMRESASSDLRIPRRTFGILLEFRLSSFEFFWWPELDEMCLLNISGRKYTLNAIVSICAAFGQTRIEHPAVIVVVFPAEG